ncbi:MAG TPA: hypothetical protein VFX59_22660 [Polyangiales bacterium]|nr:hypothetical protein [Polyangiales bacterium]
MNLQAIVAFALSLVASTAYAQGRAGYGFVASEYQSLPTLTGVLPTLAAYKVGLVLAWPAGEARAPARLDFVRAAHAQGVTVNPWLLLPEEQGYWANATNAELYDAAARALIDAWLAAGLAPSTLVVDMEMPIQRARGLGTVITGGGDVTAVSNFLRPFIDRTQYARATTVFRSLIDYAHRRGFLVELTALAQVLDDYGDGDDGIRQSFSVPLDTIAWDTVSFQAYRTLNDVLTSASAPPTTAYYVLDYALRARALFGARAGVSLGLVDPGALAPGAARYSSGSSLREDVNAAALAGISRSKIVVYSLDGMLLRPPTTQWFPAASLIRLPPLPDLATLISRLNAAQLDAAL